jgi:type III pantothenate kinase
VSIVSTLLLDLGNSRLKWAVDRDATLHVGPAIAHTATGLGDLGPLLAAAAEVESAWISSTALSLTPALIDALGAALAGFTQIFVSPKEALGIRSAYDRPETLGSDRFLAMVGARAQIAGAFLIADAGTAMTLDMVDAGGQHLGGLIVPGPVLMRDALHRGTAGVRTDEGVRLREFARNTNDAVWSGTCLACVALIGHAYRHGALGVGGEVELLLAGGSMAALQAQLSIPHRNMPNLVLEGLAQWSRAAG